jgi:hypothetical protein
MTRVLRAAMLMTCSAVSLAGTPHIPNAVKASCCWCQQQVMLTERSACNTLLNPLQGTGAERPVYA